jgi:hypothetical protein
MLMHLKTYTKLTIKFLLSVHPCTPGSLAICPIKIVYLIIIIIYNNIIILPEENYAIGLNGEGGLFYCARTEVLNNI